MKLLSLIILLTTAPAMAAVEPDQKIIDPVYAADQTEISDQSLFYEFQQFQMISSNYQLQGNLVNARIRRDLIKGIFEGAKKLDLKNVLSRLHYLEAKHEYDASEAKVIELEGEVERQRISAEVMKLYILEEGNPNAEYRREIAESFKRQTETSLAVLTALEKAAQDEVEFLKTKNEMGKHGCSADTVSKLECAKRQAEYERAVSDQRTLQLRRLAMTQSLDGTVRSIRRLFRERPLDQRR